MATKAPTGVAVDGRWEPVKAMVNKDNRPLSPAAAANLPDGKVLLWSADGRLTFGGDKRSFTAVLDPATGVYTEKLVTDTLHNMFCPGTSNLPDGRILVSGGSQSAVTTLYDPKDGTWRDGGKMVVGRGYQANTVLRDGSVLTLGGTWGAPDTTKNGERWTPSGGANGVFGTWTALPGVQVEDALTNDAQGVYRADNHMWLIPTGNGKVLHAGPSAKMHWITTEGRGDIVFAGRRGNDVDSMLGTAVMFDTGRILKVGGAENYSSTDRAPTSATNAAYVIDARHGLTVSDRINATFARSILSSVVLPDGKVMILGGQSVPKPFSDENSVLRAELFDPRTSSFRTLPAMAVERNYHSAALLLHDARVLVAGGNLGNTSTVHADYQIYTPAYLFAADGKPAVRPKILSAPDAATYGTTVTVRTDTAIASMALVRASSATHQVNNDQRRVSVSFKDLGRNTYEVSIPSNPGWVVPGDYMLFVMTRGGVPSVAKTVRVGLGGAPLVDRVEDQRDPAFVPVALRVKATGNGITYDAGSTLPPGVFLDPTTGVFRGAPTREGRYKVTVSAGNTLGATSTEFVWTVGPAFATRYVRLEATGPDVGGGPWASMAEIGLFDVWGSRIPDGDWKVVASSAQDGFPATAAIDGNPATLWHSRYAPAKPPGIHHFTIDLGRATRVGAISYLPRQDGSPNGSLRQGRVLVSHDGQDWSVAWEGDVSALVVGSARLIRLNELARGRTAKQSSDYAGLLASRAVDGVTTGDFGNDHDITHTQRGAAPWWQVDLGSVQSVTAVR
ncbi:MAG: discoidin domain-containing protein, partial [Burkholderiales bacterium]